MKKLVPWRARDAMSKSLPMVRAKFATFRDYANASVEEVIGERFGDARQLQVNSLDSMLFLNRGARFEARALPTEAQFAPAFGIGVSRSGRRWQRRSLPGAKFFRHRNRNLPLRCRARPVAARRWQGKFRPVPGEDSGVGIYGEQRGVALADFDGDGRVDLVVGQNRGPTKLFHNRGAKPGLRVRLQGPPGNPAAVGAALRLGFGQRFGPAREIHCGSGYWSQDSFVQVLATPEVPSQIWVRWPGGKTNAWALPPGAREIIVAAAGQMKVVK